MRALRLSPYESLGRFRFGDSVEAVIASAGEPSRRSTNRRSGELEFWYSDVIVRFAIAGSGVDEISASPVEVVIGDDVVPISDLANYIRRSDPLAKENVGFLESDRLGLMVDLDHDQIWVTAFTRSRQERYRKHA